MGVVTYSQDSGPGVPTLGAALPSLETHLTAPSFLPVTAPIESPSDGNPCNTCDSSHRPGTGTGCLPSGQRDGYSLRLFQRQVEGLKQHGLLWLWTEELGECEPQKPSTEDPWKSRTQPHCPCRVWSTSRLKGGLSPWVDSCGSSSEHCFQVSFMQKLCTSSGSKEEPGSWLGPCKAGLPVGGRNCQGWGSAVPRALEEQGEHPGHWFAHVQGRRNPVLQPVVGLKQQAFVFSQLQGWTPCGTDCLMLCPKSA